LIFVAAGGILIEQGATRLPEDPVAGTDTQAATPASSAEGPPSLVSPPTQRVRGYPCKGLVLGAVLCVTLSVFEPHVKLRLHTNGLCTDYVSAGALLFTFVLCLLLGGMRLMG
jgi:hypothetical protein